MQDINYPLPNDPHGYTQGGIQQGQQNGYMGRQGLRTPKRVSRDNTMLRLAPPQFGIPSVVEQDRAAPKAAGFGFSAYTGPIQNAGYAGILAENPVTDPSFGGGGAVLPTTYGAVGGSLFGGGGLNGPRPPRPSIFTR